ncbi:hypothetical protein [Kitasatospora azatica]|uniref:hypothetical protein n=1 Tax=Kitasatospora azatica TaxID=58347 RepID=UPI00055F9E4A|nr:hypothetical protein [Kitasatospora azatica]
MLGSAAAQQTPTGVTGFGEEAAAAKTRGGRWPITASVLPVYQQTLGTWAFVVGSLAVRQVQHAQR